MTALAARPSTAPRAATASRARRIAVAAIAPGLGLTAAALDLVGAGTPSYWGDEAASVMSAQRSLPSLLQELSQIDAVHGLYYALLHLWIDVAGASELATRFPSVVAAGAAVAGVVVLGRMLFGLRVGVIAGIVLAITPEATRMAIEARSYSIDIALAIWLTVLVVRMLTRPPQRTALRRAGWVGYALGLGVAVTMFEFLAFMAVVHLALVWALRADRTTARRWLTAAAAGGTLALPLMVTAFLQRGQIAFLSHHDYATLDNVLVAQWFGTVLFAAVAWAAIAAGLIGGVRDSSRRRVTIALAFWLALPTAALLVVHAVAMPVYNLRYPAFSLGGVALVMALGIDAAARLLRRRGLALIAVAVLLTVLAVGAWPKYLAQRGPYAKGGGSDIRQSSALLASLASPGDAVVFDHAVRASGRPAMAYRLYPADFAGLDNVALTTPYTDHAGIWDLYLPTDQLASRLAGHTVVWADEIRGTESADLTALRDLGYTVTAHYTVHRTVLYRMEKTAS